MNVKTAQINISKEVYTILGADPNQNFTFEYFLSLVHPEDQSKITNAFRTSDSCNHCEIEFRIIRQTDGSTRYINGKFIQEPDDNGKILNSTGILQDITEQRISNQKLKESEIQFRTIFENAADAIFIADEETGIILEVNQAAERLLKLPKSSVIGLHQSKLHPPSTEDFNTGTFHQHIQSIKQDKFTEPIENLVVDAEGSLIPVEILASKVIFEGKGSLVGTFRNISVRKKVEAELLQAREKIEENEHKFKAAFYTSPDSININKLNGEYVDINEGFTKLTGFTREDVIGKLSSEIRIWAVPEDREKLISGLKSHGIVENLESLFRTKSGELRPALMSAKIIRLKNEPHILSVTREISDRKNFENELILAKEKAEENEMKLNAFINSIPDIVCYKDPHGRWLLANDADLQLFGLSNVDYLGKTDLELALYAHPVYKEAFTLCKESDEIAWAKREISKGIELIPTSNGEKRVFDVYKIPQFYPNGERKGLAVIGRDITDLYKMQESLIAAKELAEESEEKFKQIAENSNEVFWLRNDKKMFYINPAFEKVFGIKREVAYSNPVVFIETIHPEDKSQVMKIFESDEYKFGGLFSHEYRIVRPDNEIRWILAKSNPIYSKGKLIRRVGFASDITERKKAELYLLIAKEKAEESDRLKTAFIQNMSHEIRTPMNAIMGFSELLNSNFDNKDRLHRYSEIINQRCCDLLKIINDLLDIAKIESGQLNIHIESFSLSDLLLELKDFFAVDPEKLKKPNVIFDFYMNPGIADLLIETDKLRLKQIFINLISNAFKFTESGKIEFGCTLNQHEKPVFYVSDTGIGIPRDKQNDIFKRFTQLSTDSKKNYGGTGLGLSIVKGLLHVLEGDIWLESEENQGSAFYFTLNIKRNQHETTSGTVESKTINSAKL